MGYPVTLKALSEGGGKGIRAVYSKEALLEAFHRARSEAMSSFGKSEVYLEKNVQSVKHIEVQIAGDITGHVVLDYLLPHRLGTGYAWSITDQADKYTLNYYLTLAIRLAKNGGRYTRH